MPDSTEFVGFGLSQTGCSRGLAARSPQDPEVLEPREKPL